MTNLEMQQLLKKSGYDSLEDYIERTSNEVFFDDIWLWREVRGIKYDLPNISKSELSVMLTIILKKMLEKSEKYEIIDCSHGEAGLLLEKYKDSSIPELIFHIVEFTVNNPDYGEDGNGIWINALSAPTPRP